MVEVPVVGQTERFMSVLSLFHPQSRLMLTVTDRQLHNGFYISISPIMYHTTKSWNCLQIRLWIFSPFISYPSKSKTLKFHAKCHCVLCVEGKHWNWETGKEKNGALLYVVQNTNLLRSHLVHFERHAPYRPSWWSVTIDCLHGMSNKEI